MVFMAGFPDNETSGWGSALPEELEKKYRCIFMCLPGYSQVYHISQDRPWGYDQEEILTMIDATFNFLGLKEHPFHMIAHDWGAFYALLYTTRHPTAVSRLILCDVGMVDPFSLPILTIPYIIFYQLYFTVAYIISQVISMSLGNMIFWWCKAYFQFMMPTPHDRFHIPESEISVRKCYPYYYLWRRLLTGSMLKVRFPTCPLLFMVRLCLSIAFYSIYLLAMYSLPFLHVYDLLTVRHEEALHVPRPALPGPDRRYARLQALRPAIRPLVYDRRG